MKQTSFLNLTAHGTQRNSHGGSLSARRRRSKRPLTTKRPLHITLSSELGRGARSLLRHQEMINSVLAKASRRFDVKIYQKAICRNHLHLLIRGKQRQNIRNFFRVISGHIAQNILKQFPLMPTDESPTGAKSNETSRAGGAPKQSLNPKACVKNQRKFWDLLLYSRVVTWGREFQIVSKYIIQNTLETLNLIAYKPRNVSLTKTLVNTG